MKGYCRDRSVVAAAAAAATVFFRDSACALARTQRMALNFHEPERATRGIHVRKGQKYSEVETCASSKQSRSQSAAYEVRILM